MYLKYLRGKTLLLDERIKIKDNNLYTFSLKNQKIILGGKFYYFNSFSRKNILFSKNPKQKLNVLLKEKSIESFINSVEGEYWGLKIDYKKELLTFFSDKLKQLDLYYFYNSKVFIASSDPREIIKEIGWLPYESTSLISAVSFYLPRGNSLFQGIKRLKYNEVIEITEKKTLHTIFNDKDVNIVEYDKNDFLSYDKIVENSILSRASDKINLIFSSSGWDSTLILALLRKNFDKDKVRGITMKIIFPDGSCFNEFEVEKVKKIKKFFGIKTDVVEINYKKDNLSFWLEKEKSNLFHKGLFFLGPANWAKTINYIRKKYSEDITIFHGEGCDSLHNYGFSQFESLLHENKSFRLYADKMHNYLFSPSFFKKIKDNSYLDDNVYKIFKSLYKDKKFIDIEKLSNDKKIYYYLLSFLLSDIRIPFRKIENKYIKPLAFKNFENWLKKEYFNETIKNINEENFYYYLSSLYVNFHLQSPQIKIYRTGLNNVKFPFIDLNLFKFLYKMPEKFGRGLELKPTKFPEKELAKKIMPTKLIDILEKGNHSYLSEVQKINPYDGYWLKGKVYDYMRHNISNNKIRKIFNENIFQTDLINNFISNFKKGELKSLSSSDTKLLIALFILNTCSND